MAAGFDVDGGLSRLRGVGLIDHVWGRALGGSEKSAYHHHHHHHHQQQQGRVIYDAMHLSVGH